MNSSGGANVPLDDGSDNGIIGEIRKLEDAAKSYQQEVDSIIN